MQGTIIRGNINFILNAVDLQVGQKSDALQRYAIAVGAASSRVQHCYTPTGAVSLGARHRQKISIVVSAAITGSAVSRLP